MAKVKISIFTVPQLLPSLFLFIFFAIPLTTTLDSHLPEFETKLKSRSSQNTPLDLEQAPAEAVPLRYHIAPPPKYNHAARNPEPQPLTLHRRASHDPHNLNLHYRKLEDDETQNHQYLKPSDSESYNYNRPNRKSQDDEIQNRQFFKPSDSESYSYNRPNRKPQDEDLPNRQYQKPATAAVAEYPFNLNTGGGGGGGRAPYPYSYQRQAEGDVPSNRQYRKPQDSEPDAVAQSPSAVPHNTPSAAEENPPALVPDNTPAPSSPAETPAPKNQPSTTPIPLELPTEPQATPDSPNVSEQQLKSQKMELLRLIDQVGFDRAIHIFENRIKAEFNPTGPAPTKQESNSIVSNVLKNLTTYHIYKPDQPLIEIIEPPTTTTTLKPQFPDNVESPIDLDYTGGDDLNSAREEQQDARDTRQDNPNHFRVAKSAAQAVGQLQSQRQPHQEGPQSKINRTPTTKRPDSRKTSPKFKFSLQPVTQSTTPSTTTIAPIKKSKGCPSFLEFKLGAVILWENLKQTNNIFGGIHLIVEAILEAMKSLGSCFFSISGEIFEAINNFFSVDNNPVENDPEKKYLNSSRV